MKVLAAAALCLSVTVLPQAIAETRPPTTPWIQTIASRREASVFTLRFARGETQVPPSSRSVLDAIASRLLSHREFHLEVRAYATATGGRDNSRLLSLERAVAVRRYLVGRGVPSPVITAYAFSSRAPDRGDLDRVDLTVR